MGRSSENKSIQCGRCKYSTDVPADLHPEYNTRDCVLIQSGAPTDAVCRRYLAPRSANHPFHNVQHFGGGTA